MTDLTCPDCGATVNPLFGLEAHQRGARCSALRNIAKRAEQGFVELTGTIAASLLDDDRLRDLVRQGVVGVDERGRVKLGYLVPGWFRTVLEAEPETLSAITSATRFDGLSTVWIEGVVTPSSTLQDILYILSRASMDDREAFLAALRLAGLRAARVMLPTVRVPEPEEESG